MSKREVLLNVLNHYNLEELKTLCFILDVDDEDLGSTKLSVARELILRMENRGQTSKLYAELVKERPDDPSWQEWTEDDKVLPGRIVNLRPLDVSRVFKDRERKLQEIRGHLLDPAVRLIKVTGRSGIGKTALVSRVLGDVERTMSLSEEPGQEPRVDGIIYLGAATGLGIEAVYAGIAALLPPSAAAPLKAEWVRRDATLNSKARALLTATAGRVYVILLDNLETYLDRDCNITEDGLRVFIEACLVLPNQLRLITTSTQEIKIAPAGLYATRRVRLDSGLPPRDSVALLRALDEGDLGLGEVPEPTLRDAAALTYGIPRALEILAGILSQEPDVNLSDLVAGHSLKHQVMDGLLAQEFRRLEDDERRVAEALAVIEVPARHETVEYLLQPWCPRLDVRSALLRLAHHLFASASRATGEFSLHSLERRYAYRELRTRGENGGYTGRDLELRMAGFYHERCKPQEEWKGINDLEAQLREFRHRVRGQDYTTAYRVLDTIDGDYLYSWGYFRRLMRMRDALRGRLRLPEMEASNLHRLGLCHHELGGLARAKALYEDALKLCDEPTRQLKSEILSDLGFALCDLGFVMEAIKLYDTSLAISTELDDLDGKARDWGYLGVAYQMIGKTEEAIELHKKALQATRELHEVREPSIHLGNLGVCYCSLGHFDEAVAACDEALRIEGNLTYRQGAAIDLDTKAFARYLSGQLDEAARLYQDALETSSAIGYKLGQAWHLIGLATIALAEKAFGRARDHCKTALALDMDETNYKAAWYLGIASLGEKCPAAANDFDRAEQLCLGRLQKTEELCEERYTHAGTLVGIAVSDVRWNEVGSQAGLLKSALTEYRRAISNAHLPGLIISAARDLELLEGAGVTGLEPAIELLRLSATDG